MKAWLKWNKLSRSHKKKLKNFNLDQRVTKRPEISWLLGGFWNMYLLIKGAGGLSSSGSKINKESADKRSRLQCKLSGFHWKAKEVGILQEHLKASLPLSNFKLLIMMILLVSSKIAEIWWWESFYEKKPFHCKSTFLSHLGREQTFFSIWFFFLLDEKIVVMNVYRQIGHSLFSPSEQLIVRPQK